MLTKLRSVRVLRHHDIAMAAALMVHSLALAGLPASQTTETQPAGMRAVADFSTSVRTAHDGWVHVVGGRPDVVRDRLAEVGQPATRAWRIDVLAGAPAEAVGGILPLFDNLRGSAGQPLDVRDSPYLELRLTGELNQRQLRVEVLSECVDDVQPAGTTVLTVASRQLDPARWASLRTRAGTDAAPPAKIGAIRLLLAGDGPAWVAIAGVRFVARDSDTPWPTAAAAPRRTALRKAMWVWTTAEIWPDPPRRAALIDFARKFGFTDLYCQLSYAYDDGTVTLHLRDEQRALNKAARDAGIRVHALDGHPQYALVAQHERMFKLVAAIDEFNRTSPAESRYAAVHLDNEPYLLPEWKDAATRPRVIEDFVALNRELRQRCNAADLAFGIDIPFWFDLRGKGGTPEFAVTQDGAQLSLVEALFRSAQNVGIMSYRERVTGPNGVVAVCQTEFELGIRYGVDVFASIELGTGPQVERGITFGVYPLDYLHQQLTTLQHALALEKGCRGLAIHDYDRYKSMEESR